MDTGLVALPWVTTAAAVAYGVYMTLRLRGEQAKSKGQVNLKIQKNENKVVHTYDVEDMEPKAVFCRCWRSNKFPYCDGTHNKHNETTGDNVGPLIIQKKNN